MEMECRERGDEDEEKGIRHDLAEQKKKKG